VATTVATTSTITGRVDFMVVLAVRSGEWFTVGRLETEVEQSGPSAPPSTFRHA
jgi:hypothetical protein